MLGIARDSLPSKYEEEWLCEQSGSLTAAVAFQNLNLIKLPDLVEHEYLGRQEK